MMTQRNRDLNNSELGMIGGAEASTSKLVKKKLTKLKVKGITSNNKKIIDVSYNQEASRDNIQDSGVLSMEGKENRFDTKVTDNSPSKPNEPATEVCSPVSFRGAFG